MGLDGVKAARFMAAVVIGSGIGLHAASAAERPAPPPPPSHAPPQLERTDHATYCPYKGDCSYYSVPAGGKKSVNAVWSYEDPYPAVAQIKEYVAFYPNRVDEIADQLPTTRESAKK